MGLITPGVSPNLFKVTVRICQTFRRGRLALHKDKKKWDYERKLAETYDTFRLLRSKDYFDILDFLYKNWDQIQPHIQNTQRNKKEYIKPNFENFETSESHTVYLFLIHCRVYRAVAPPPAASACNPGIICQIYPLSWSRNPKSGDQIKSGSSGVSWFLSLYWGYFYTFPWER